jgi:hypothetical protein
MLRKDRKIREIRLGRNGRISKKRHKLRASVSGTRFKPSGSVSSI